jgi:branched-chain amino acid transport system permease protein
MNFTVRRGVGRQGAGRRAGRGRAPAVGAEVQWLRKAGPLPFVAGMALLAFLPWLGVNALWLQLTELILFFAMLTSGLNLTFGFAGELSFSQPALYALGAYLAGYMAVNGYNDVVLTVVSGAVAAGLAGLVIGIPALRLSGWSMAMVSFFLILALPDIINVLQAQTGGTSGLGGIPQPEVFGTALGARGYFVTCVLVAALVLLLTRNVVRSRHGTAFLVLRESPVLAQSLGINIYWLKVRAYILGSVAAGAAGALFAYLYGYVSPASFDFDTAVALIAASVIGGSRSVYGCLIGAALVEVGPFESSSFQNYSLVVYGLLLVAAGVLLPNGLPALAARVWRSAPVQSRLPLRWRSLPAGAPADGSGAAAMIEPQAPAEKRPMAELGPTRWAKRAADAPEGQRRRGVTVVDLHKNFGGVTALDGVSLEARPGQITALIGPNGSGKTTLLNVIAGVYPPSGGQVLLDDVPIGGRAPSRALSAGIARTFQTPSIPGGLTVLEAVKAARYRIQYVGLASAMLHLPRYRRVCRADEEIARGALEAAGLSHVSGVAASTLPLGTRRLVEVARALAAQPEVLLLDEPASGLGEDDIGRLARVLRDFREAGGVVILVEHNFGFVSEVADHIHVLELGRLLASGSPQSIREHPEVVRSYLGAELDVRSEGTMV